MMMNYVNYDDNDGYQDDDGDGKIKIAGCRWERLAANLLAWTTSPKVGLMDYIASLMVMMMMTMMGMMMMLVMVGIAGEPEEEDADEVDEFIVINDLNIVIIVIMKMIYSCRSYGKKQNSKGPTLSFRS